MYIPIAVAPIYATTPPQGGVASPLLANLFLHYAFDEWTRRNYPGIAFERYADDVICHCHSQKHAQALRTALEKRLAECGFQLHPEKTQIVYCLSDGRTAAHDRCQFDFLGYTFRPPVVQSRTGLRFVSFAPAISRKAAKAIRQVVRRWRLHCWHTVDLVEVAHEINPTFRGWMNYYGRFHRSALHAVFDTLDIYLARWLRRKYRNLKEKITLARQRIGRIRRRNPALFVHWNLSFNGGQ